MTELVVTADDFGLSQAVNEGVERAHLDGILTSASLMVAGVAVADAVARARRLPSLRVGLHLVLIEGRAVLPHAAIPGLVDAQGMFPSDQVGRSVAYAFDSRVRRQLRAEIIGQFEAFAATGLALDHANAHKHMHLHPVVAGIMIDVGRTYGLRAIRVPAEPPAVLARAGSPASAGARALYRWSGVLRSQARRAGLMTPDAVFGLAWSGQMTEAALLRLAPHLPPGVVEVYTHPAAKRDAVLGRLMPYYQHEAELAALLSPQVRAALSGARLTSYGALAARRPAAYQASA